MKIVVIGASGTIGKAIRDELGPRHEIISVGHTHGDIQIDISQKDSIETLYKKITKIDAVVLATGRVPFGALDELEEKDYLMGLQSKLMGQVNTVLLGLKYINDRGSFTLTSGILNDDPVQYGSVAATVNGGIDSFVKAAALEMPRGIRINCVSPTVITESMEKLGSYFRGFNPVPVSQVALAYSKSIEGLQTGQIYRVGY